MLRCSGAWGCFQRHTCGQYRLICCSASPSLLVKECILNTIAKNVLTIFHCYSYDISAVVIWRSLSWTMSGGANDREKVRIFTHPPPASEIKFVQNINVHWTIMEHYSYSKDINLPETCLALGCPTSLLKSDRIF